MSNFDIVKKDNFKSTQISIIGRISHPALITPVLNNLIPNQKVYEYKCDILFPQTIAKEKMDLLEGAIHNALIQKYKNPASFPEDLIMPIKKGEDKKNHDDYDGHFYISSKANADRGAIVVVDSNYKTITQQDAIVGGDWVALNLNFYAYDKAGKRGVSAGLVGAMLVSKTDEPFSGISRNPAKLFDSPEDNFDSQNADMF